MTHNHKAFIRAKCFIVERRKEREREEKFKSQKEEKNGTESWIENKEEQGSFDMGKEATLNRPELNNDTIVLLQLLYSTIWICIIDFVMF